MKVALCLSGQMRTYRECYRSLDKFILQPLQPDVFIHTWENQGVSIRSNGTLPWWHRFLPLAVQERGKGFYSEEDKAVDPQDLQKKFDPKVLKIERFLPTFVDSLHGVTVPESARIIESMNYKGLLPMFYKIWACHQEAIRFDSSYDLFIRLRPDLFLKKAIPEEVLAEPDKIWVIQDDIETTFKASDRFAISGLRGMSYYASIWEKIPSYMNQPLEQLEFERRPFGERLVKQHLEKGDIQYKYFTSGSYILRKKLTVSTSR
jgi:hypothetical protein